MYMLDTNIVSQLIRGNPQVAQKIRQVPVRALCISAVTGAELHYGLAKRTHANTLHAVVHAFLRHVDVLPWDQGIMPIYGELRAHLQGTGVALGSLDMLIAAHALQAQLTLVTNDAAFARIPQLLIEDWTAIDTQAASPNAQH